MGSDAQLAAHDL